MQEHDGFAVCRFPWRDIHIGHAEQLPLDCEIEEVHCIRIVDILKADAKSGMLGLPGDFTPPSR